MLTKIFRAAVAIAAFVILLAVAGWFARFEIMRISEGLPAFTHSAAQASDETVAMRDGVLLAATIYQPEGDGPWPTVLIRNPYQGFDFIVGGWCE